MHVLAGERMLCETAMTVQALYVMPDGHYPEMLGRENCWDITRDAKTYAGPWPVVAHPPCGPWGRMKFLCTKQDPTCGPRAVEQVRAYGGVLEHPSGSSLWKHCGLPRPGAPADVWGGYTLEVRQVAWGHRCEKPTMLYIVGCPREIALAGVRTGGVATHRITNGSRGKTQLPRVGAKEASQSPPAFAQFLLTIASKARVGG